MAAMTQRPVAAERNSASCQAMSREPKLIWDSWVKWVKSVFVVKLEAEWNARSHVMLGTPVGLSGRLAWSKKNQNMNRSIPPLTRRIANMYSRAGIDRRGEVPRSR